MFGPKKQQGRLSQIARALESGGGFAEDGDTLSPNSVRSMLNAFRKPLGLPLYEAGTKKNVEETSVESGNKPALLKNKVSPETACTPLIVPLFNSDPSNSALDTKTPNKIIVDENTIPSSSTGSLTSQLHALKLDSNDLGAEKRVEDGSLIRETQQTISGEGHVSNFNTTVVISKETSSASAFAQSTYLAEPEVARKVQDGITQELRYHNESTAEFDKSKSYPVYQPFSLSTPHVNEPEMISKAFEPDYMCNSKTAVLDKKVLAGGDVAALTFPLSEAQAGRKVYDPKHLEPSNENNTAEVEKRPSCVPVLGPFSTPTPRRFPGLPQSSTSTTKMNPVQQPSTANKKKQQANCWKLTTEKVQGISYLLLKQLGKGGCGEVYLVMENETRELYALKKVNMQLMDAAGVQECINEVTMLLELKNTELVIHIVDWEIDNANKILRIIMEYGQCDLSKTINSKSNTLIKIKSCWESMLQIVQTIHEKEIVHGDLKPANFVWVAGRLKIIDFGIANRVQMDVTSIQTYNPKGTLNFMSPESIRPDAFGRAKIGPKSDIWSLGCILYLMIYGFAPFQNYPNQISKMNAIISGAIQYPPYPSYITDNRIFDVLQLCFQVDSRNRPDATTLLRHPFLAA